MWKAQGVAEDAKTGKMVEFVLQGEGDVTLAAQASKRVREITGNKMMVCQTFGDSVVFFEGEFVVGFVNVFKVDE